MAGFGGVGLELGVSELLSTLPQLSCLNQLGLDPQDLDRSAYNNSPVICWIEEAVLELPILVNEK